jgi:DNA primase
VSERFHAGPEGAPSALAIKKLAHDIPPMSFPSGFLDDLRGRTSLVRLVGRKVTWDNRKSNTTRGDYWAPCPFHQERTASFHVDEAKGFYYCFGCQAKGDAIDFLCNTENMSFLEAVEMLARDAGMAMPERSGGAAPGVTDRRSRLYAAMEAAVAFYRLELATSRGSEARAYLDRRGLVPATRERFDLGFAPPGWRTLAEHLAAKGFREDELLEAGLIKEAKDGGRRYDVFRDRVIFPIRDASGRPIALGGRTLEVRDGTPKYLNSPETPLFDKGRTLFNFREARAAAGRAGPLIVAEGYTDVIALVQAGFEAAVAPLGTSVTENQLELLWRVTPEPVVALDGDGPGISAAQRLIDRALPLLVAGRSLRFVLLPPGQDPDDLIRASGRAAMAALIENSLPVVELLWRRETEGHPLDSPERRAALDARLKGHLARIRDESLRNHTWADLRERRARLFGRGSARTGEAGARGRPLAGGSASAGRRDYADRFADRARGLRLPASAAAKESLLASAPDGAAAEARVRESAILLGLLNNPALLPRFEERLDRMAFVCPDLAEVRDALLSCSTEGLPVMAEAGPRGEPPEDETTAGGPATRSGTEGLIERMNVRLGRDPRDRLPLPGQLRANPHLAAGADAARTAAAIEEEIIRHALWIEKEAEVREAMLALGSAAGDLDEGLTWRLRQAADAQHESARAGPSDDGQTGENAAEMSRRLQEMIDRQVWKRSRGKR